MEVWGSGGRLESTAESGLSAATSTVTGKPQVIPYVPTGIVKGRWNRDAVENLFATHGIRVSYEERGWWDPATYVRSSLGTKLRKLPGYAWDRVRSL